MLPVAFPDMLNQTATYWAPGLTPNGFGDVNFSAPITIRCRWQPRSQLARSSSGEEFVSTAVIYPDRELAVKGYLALGDRTATTNPKTLQGVAFEIRTFNESPDIRAQQSMAKALV